MTTKEPKIAPSTPVDAPKSSATAPKSQPVKAYLPLGPKVDLSGVDRLLRCAEMHGATVPEAIVTPAMLYELKRIGFTSVCIMAEQDPYKTDTYGRRPCLDDTCAKYGGSLILIKDTGDFKCNRCAKEYSRRRILQPCPVCGELMLRRGAVGAEGTNYCPAGDVVLPDAMCAPED